MSIARLVASMKAAGCSAEQIGNAALTYSEGGERSSAAIRQARYRVKKKGSVALTEGITGDVTGDVTGDAERYVSAPPLAGAVFIGEELDIPPEKPTASTPKGAAGRSDRGTRLAEDWEPSEADRQFARERLPSSNACREELAKFREHFLAKPGSAARKLDWSLTWRKWVRTAAERLPPRAQGPPRRTDGLSPRMNALKELYRECSDADKETPAEPSWSDASGVGGRIVGRIGGAR